MSKITAGPPPREDIHLKIGTIDRALVIHSDDDDEEALENVETSPSFLRRIGLRRSGSRDETSRKSRRMYVNQTFIFNESNFTFFHNRFDFLV